MWSTSLHERTLKNYSLKADFKLWSASSFSLECVCVFPRVKVGCHLKSSKFWLGVVKHCWFWFWCIFSSPFSPLTYTHNCKLGKNTFRYYNTRSVIKVNFRKIHKNQTSLFQGFLLFSYRLLLQSWWWGKQYEASVLVFCWAAFLLSKGGLNVKEHGCQKRKDIAEKRLQFVKGEKKYSKSLLNQIFYRSTIKLPMWLKLLSNVMLFISGEGSW